MWYYKIFATVYSELSAECVKKFIVKQIKEEVALDPYQKKLRKKSLVNGTLSDVE